MFKFFRFFRSRWDRRFVEHGRVACPERAGGVDIERCFACCKLIEVEAKSDVPFLRCQSENPADPREFVA